jgi:hypothetical protein
MKRNLRKKVLRLLSADYFAEKNFVRDTVFIGAKDDCHDEEQILHICFNTNKGYFSQLGVTITSILETNKDKKIVFHIFIDERIRDEEERIRTLSVKYHRDFYFMLWNQANLKASMS